jgi:hypothetical protein
MPAKPLAANSKDNRAFQTPDGEVHIQLRDRSVLVIEGLSADQSPGAGMLKESLWKR